MLFNSLNFLYFFLGLLLISYIVPARFLKILLLVASLVFYSFWYPPYLIMLLLTVSLNYIALRKIYYLKAESTDANAKQEAKRLLISALFANLFLLFGFKYLHFAASLFGYQLPSDFRWALPLGISFYTFEAIACLVDTYKRENPFPPRFQDFLFFVSFFPHLIAGPILRIKTDWSHVMSPIRPNFSSLNSGIFLFTWGLAKKLLIADNLATLVDSSFNHVSELNPATALLGIYAFAIQIYCDFSGYVDMALGLALCFGIELPDNFRAPYFADSITDFWRRWHITLSSWLRDYLYIPLGGNRHGSLRTYLNLLTTMILGGLWHGANLTFVVWGLLHGLYLSLEKLLDLNSQATSSNGMQRFFKQILTFHLVLLAWIFFRAANLETACLYIQKLFSSINFIEYTPYLGYTYLILTAWLIHILSYRYQIKSKLASWRLEFRLAFLLLAVILIVLFGVKQDVRFIYFDF